MSAGEGAWHRDEVQAMSRRLSRYSHRQMSLLAVLAARSQSVPDQAIDGSPVPGKHFSPFDGEEFPPSSLLIRKCFGKHGSITAVPLPLLILL